MTDSQHFKMTAMRNLTNSKIRLELEAKASSKSFKGTL